MSVLSRSSDGGSAPYATKASPISSAYWYLSSALFSRAFWTIASSPGSTSTPIERKVGGGSSVMARHMSGKLGWSKGTRPASIWYSSTPTA